MADDYSLNDYVQVGGGLSDMVPASVDSFLGKWVGGHYIFWAIMIVLMIIVIASLSGAIASLKASLTGKQTFMPTATMWGASQDQSNVGSARTQNFYPMRGTQALHAYDKVENLSTPPANAPDAGVDALANAPSSYTNAQILSSNEFNCANRKSAGNDAWGWMMGVANAENYITGPNKPIGDNQFSQTLAGH